MLQAMSASRKLLRLFSSELDHGRRELERLEASRRSCISRACTTSASSFEGASQLNWAAHSPKDIFLRYGRSLSMASKVSATATILTGNDTSLLRSLSGYPEPSTRSWWERTTSGMPCHGKVTLL